MCIRDRRCCPHSGGGLCAAARGRLPQLRLPGVLSSAARGPAGGAVTTVQAPPAGSRALRPDDLCGLLDVPLTAEQLAAATAPLEPGVIVAGAGSGKTTVMAGRVVWLVATGQVQGGPVQCGPFQCGPVQRDPGGRASRGPTPARPPGSRWTGPHWNGPHWTGPPWT